MVYCKYVLVSSLQLRQWKSAELLHIFLNSAMSKRHLNDVLAVQCWAISSDCTLNLPHRSRDFASQYITNQCLLLEASCFCKLNYVLSLYGNITVSGWGCSAVWWLLWSSLEFIEVQELLLGKTWWFVLWW